MDWLLTSFAGICCVMVHFLVCIDGHIIEVCPNMAESLDISCGRDSVILVNQAWFGRMAVGRCVTSDLGYMGCATDIRHLADKWCSGRRRCDVAIPNQDIMEVNQCSLDYILYLEVDYDCVKVIDNNGHDCQRPDSMRIHGSSGVLPSILVEEIGCGTGQSPWIITSHPGQRVNITMLDFSPRISKSLEKSYSIASHCEAYGFIAERKLGINRTVCGGLDRWSHVYTSTSNTVELQLNAAKVRKSNGTFLIKYQVTGCPDTTPPAHAWYKRTGNTAEIGCEWSKTSWQLTCEDNVWVGVVGNCSVREAVASPSTKGAFQLSAVMSLGIVIGLAALAVVLLVVIGVGYYCLKRRKTAVPDLPPPDETQRVLPVEPFPTYSQVRKKPRVTSATHTFVPAGGPPPSGGAPTPRPRAPPRDGTHRPIWERTLPQPTARAQQESLYQPIITQPDIPWEDADTGRQATLPPPLTATGQQATLAQSPTGGKPPVLPQSPARGQQATSGAQSPTAGPAPPLPPPLINSGQQMSTEGDYLTPCRTGPAPETVTSSDYEPFPKGDELGEENSQVNDDYWEAESNFQYFGPDLGSRP